MEFQPVQLVEETKQYEFKPYVEENGLNPYKVYYLVKDKEVYKMTSISYGNVFVIMPLLAHRQCCYTIEKNKNSIKDLLQIYNEIYTVPSEYDSDHQEEYTKAFDDLTKWVYEELIPELLYKRENK